MGWSVWKDLGTPSGQVLKWEPAVVMTGPNEIYCFVVADNGGVWYKKGNADKWSDWVALEYWRAFTPIEVVNITNYIYVFTRDYGSTIHYNRLDKSVNKWSGWTRINTLNLSCDLFSAPAVVAWGERIYMFAIGNGNNLYWKALGPEGDSACYSVGGSFKIDTQPFAIADYASGISVWAMGTDGIVKLSGFRPPTSLNQAHQWSQWINTEYPTVPKYTMWDVGSYRTFVGIWMNNEGHLLYQVCEVFSPKICPPSDWGTLYKGAGMDITSWSGKQIDLFMRFPTLNRIQHMWWTP